MREHAYLGLQVQIKNKNTLPCTVCYQASTLCCAKPAPAPPHCLDLQLTLRLPGQPHTALPCFVWLHINLSPDQALLINSLKATGLMQHKYLHWQIYKRPHTDGTTFSVSCPALTLPPLQTTGKGDIKASQICRTGMEIIRQCWAKFYLDMVSKLQASLLPHWCKSDFE